MWRKLKRWSKYALEALTTEAAGALLSWTITILLFGGAAAFPSRRELLLAASATLAITQLVKQAVGWYEYRHENYTIKQRTSSIRLLEEGRVVEFTMSMTLRSRQRNLAGCDIRLSWSGESDLTQSWKIPPTADYTVQAKRSHEFTNFEFRFSHKLAWGRSKKVELLFRLEEPERKYLPFVSLDPAAWAWSKSSSQLVLELSWQDDIVDVTQVEAAAFRSGWDIHRQRHAAMRYWKSEDLDQSGAVGMSCRALRISPVRNDRWYLLEWKWRRSD